MRMTGSNRKTTLRGLLLITAAMLLAACSSTAVKQGGARPASTAQYGESVTVRRGDTLYRIATSKHISALDLATWNGVSPPYTIYPGQRLKLYPGGSTSAASTSRGGAQATRPSAATATRPSIPVPAPATSPFAWKWPADGQIVGGYVSGEPTKQGIDIAGKGGQPVRAAADGVVVYSGSGLVGYGELVIVKHNDQWLSAYGHNRARLVNEGQVVKAGQQIAEMGRSGASRDMLHFEVRYNGKPVDPQLYLPKR